MANSPFVADVTLQDFDALVLEKSRQVPVLVDFWAAWCGPCQMLMPLLAKLAEEYAGKFFLAKVNTDVEQKLARNYGIRSLPTVKLFRNGEAVQEFMGMQPERTIRQLLDRYVARASDTAATEALHDYGAGQIDAAIGKLEAAVKQDPSNDRVRLQLAKVLVEQGRLAESETVLDGLTSEGRHHGEAQALRARLGFMHVANSAPTIEVLQARVSDEPGNSEARYQLAAREILGERFEPALEQLLEIVRHDRKFKDDAARKAMLATFGILGEQHALVKKYRARLSMALH